MKCTLPTGYTLKTVRECFASLSAFESLMESYNPGCVVVVADPFLYPHDGYDTDGVQIILQVDCEEDVVEFLCAKAQDEGYNGDGEDEIRAYVDTLKFRESDANHV